MNEDKKSAAEEALPTQTVNSEPGIFENTISATNELMIVSFYLPGRSDPIIINGAKTITIGRRDPKRRINPSIDLTEDEGAKLGVSRLHAELNFVNGQYYVKDTGSSNGTWVNDTKLQPYQPHPVQSGDRIRVGQMAIMIHVTLPQRPTTGDVISTLIEETHTEKQYSYRFKNKDGSSLIDDGGIATGELGKVNTYLDQVSHIYKIIREAQETESGNFQVKALRIQASTNSLLVEVSKGTDIMNFLARKLPSFLRVMEGQAEGSKPQTDSLQRYPEPLEQVADYAIQEIVFKFLSEDARDDYVHRLASHFEALLATRLELEVVDD